jgi:hypothetical protein
MRNDDLLESLASELDFQLSRQPRSFRRAPYRKLIREANQCQRRLNGEGTHAQQQEAEEYASEIVNDLMDSLSEFAPPLAYFGSHPGDGADYGFWLHEDFQSCFDGLQVEDTSDIPRDYRGDVLHINERGNVTLYVAMSRGELKEIWAVV